jgi:hypothetical protein
MEVLEEEVVAAGLRVDDENEVHTEVAAIPIGSSQPVRSPPLTGITGAAAVVSW